MPSLVPKPAVNSISRLVYDFNKPQWMIKELICDINMGLKMFKLISQRNFLTKCRSLKICPMEIRNLASRIASDRRRVFDWRQEDAMMKTRITNTNKDIKKIKEEWRISTTKIRE